MEKAKDKKTRPQEFFFCSFRTQFWNEDSKDDLHTYVLEQVSVGKGPGDIDKDKKAREREKGEKEKERKRDERRESERACFGILKGT